MSRSRACKSGCPDTNFICLYHKPYGRQVMAIMGMQTDIISNFWSVLLIGFLTQVPSELHYFSMILITAMIIVLWVLLPGAPRLFQRFLGGEHYNFCYCGKKMGCKFRGYSALGAGQRYFYIPYVLVTWVFILGILQAPKPANWIAMALVLMIIASAARTFQAPPLPDMEWAGTWLPSALSRRRFRSTQLDGLLPFIADNPYRKSPP